MHKRIGLMGLAGASLLAVLLACGEGGGEGGATCSTDGDCKSGEICHPDAQVCVLTCESGNDCPDSAKNCEALSATDTQKICKCTTDQLCAGGDTTGSSVVCSTQWEVCVTKCGSDSDCPVGSACDTGTGQCGPSGQACTSWKDDSCGSGMLCNETTQRCETAATCSASNPQPDTCSYGQTCSGSTCEYVPAVDPATCSNFANTTDSAAQAALNWTPATGTGPIIYSVTQTSDDATFCQATAPNNVRVSVKAYQKDGTFPSTFSALQGFFYVKVAGEVVDITGASMVRPTSGYTVSNNGKNAEILVNFCIPATQNQIQVGLFFTNGNAFCGDFT